MAPDCTVFRDRWLETAPGGLAGVGAELEVHPRSCEACSAWAARTAGAALALQGLSRLSAPPALLERTAAGLGERERQAEPRWAALLAELERPRTPAVLERLVAEELAAPEGARARRFAGDLERLPTPTALELRMFGPDRATIRPARAMRWLAAAAALFAGALAVARTGGGAPERPFEVVYELPADPHPLVASLVDGWATVRIRPGGRDGAATEGSR